MPRTTKSLAWENWQFDEKYFRFAIDFDAREKKRTQKNRLKFFSLFCVCILRFVFPKLSILYELTYLVCALAVFVDFSPRTRVLRFKFNVFFLVVFAAVAVAVVTHKRVGDFCLFFVLYANVCVWVCPPAACFYFAFFIYFAFFCVRSVCHLSSVSICLQVLAKD